uniref:Uncharacterized protein n=1 Tax=Arundo donax TaxID=35708 RepID=A0A0A8ZZH4_ARUDO
MAGFFGYCLSVYGRYKRMVMEDPNGKNKKVA